MQNLLSVPEDSGRERREKCRAMLKTQFHITSAFVPVKTIAAVIGMSPATLYGYIRSDVFFMPYRRINKTPVVELDDLVEWYCSDEKVSAGARQKVAWIIDAAPENAKANLSEAARAQVSSKSGLSNRADRAVEDALRELGLQHRKRRP